MHLIARSMDDSDKKNDSSATVARAQELLEKAEELLSSNNTQKARVTLERCVELHLTNQLNHGRHS